LLSLQLLLCTPNPDDPQDGVVAQMYRRSVAEFEAEARKWTATYSTPVARGGAPAAPRPPPPFPFPDALTQLTEMGFPEEDSKRALVATKGDVGDAVAQLTA
jgi:ubiquitin-conjugating enzyme (huntingtin interacting protein 2)